MTTATATRNVLQGRDEIESFLGTIAPGATFLTIEAMTIAKQNKSRKDEQGNKIANPLADVDVLKVNKVNGMIDIDYAQNVRNAIAKEQGIDPATLPDDAFIGGKSWHHPEMDDQGRFTAFARHNKTDVRYLRFRHLKTIGEPTYIREDTGEEVSAEHVKAFAPAVKRYENQPQENKVRFVVYGIESLRAITVGGDKWEVTP